MFAGVEGWVNWMILRKDSQGKRVYVPLGIESGRTWFPVTKLDMRLGEGVYLSGEAGQTWVCH